MRELLMIVFVTMCTLGSQLLVKRGVNLIAERTPDASGLAWLMQVVLSPSIIAAVAIQGVGFLVWVAVVSRMKLGMAFAISGAFFYLAVALASWWFYGERLNPFQWTGLVMISFGVVLMVVTAN